MEKYQMHLPERHPAMKPTRPLAEPLFDPEIITRHIPASFILDCMSQTLGESFTDDGVSAAVPHPMSGGGGRRDVEHGDAMAERILKILEELRDLGVLHPIPHGADRQVREAVEWNGFVEKGRSGISEYGLRDLMRCPLPMAIAQGAWEGAYETLRDLRVDRGFERHAGTYAKDKVGPKADMPMTADDLPAIAEAAALSAKITGSGMKRHVMIGRDITCRKTDTRLAWKEEALLAPSLGIWHYPEWGTKGQTRWEDLGPWVAPKSMRHLEMTLPSGVLMMADWFRIPGFNEGVSDPEDQYKSINSDEGIDQRTRDHFERLGLMRIHTTNCVPNLVKDGEAIRVGWLDEDHDCFWTDDGKRKDVAMPESLGRICCDLWDATFTDREILIDILVAGGEKLAANGGVDERDREVSGYATSREEASALLDAYAAEHSYVRRLEFEPGATLHVYMATGHGAQLFGDKFRSPDLQEWEFMDELFIISTKELEIAPEIAGEVEEADWVWPERYAATSPDMSL